MARSIATIQAAMLTDVNATPELNGSLANPPFTISKSKRAIYRLWTYIFATAISILESIIDVFKSDVEAIAAKSAAASALWVQDKIFQFQYDPITPQILKLLNTVPVYDAVDPSKRIITRCSVKTDLSNNVIIKVAQQEPPIALDADMISSAQGYINTIGTAGITYNLTSGDADRLFIKGDIYFEGQYSATILASIDTAINDFLSTLPFNGAVKVSDIEGKIKSVVGVIDVVLILVKARANSTGFADGTELVLNAQTISRLWNTTTGYIVPEDTAGNTLADSLNLIVQ